MVVSGSSSSPSAAQSTTIRSASKPDHLQAREVRDKDEAREARCDGKKRREADELATRKQ
ncbi:hypothetical protein E4U55_004518 [Claviceps digitariae]|nr:hypothetical protein E4U55_004518 [Claviceps digitariae]